MSINVTIHLTLNKKPTILIKQDISQNENIFLEIIKLIFTPSLMMTLCGYDLVYLMCSLVIFSLPLPALPHLLPLLCNLSSGSGSCGNDRFIVI